MYAWNQRVDTTVLDEPMYAHYLVATGIDHPVREEVLAAHPSDEGTVIDLMLNSDSDTPLLFIKNMAHHLEGMDAAIIDRMDNFILTRDPSGMLPSLARALERVPTMDGTGYAAQVEILDRIVGSGREPIVVDSTSLLNDPEAMLSKLCSTLEVPFDSAMLSWPAGPKGIDGAWGPHWYQRLYATTGFEPAQGSREAVPDELVALYEECRPLYERLSHFAIDVRD
jgi:hypothetical protein